VASLLLTKSPSSPQQNAAEHLCFTGANLLHRVLLLKVSAGEACAPVGAIDSNAQLRAHRDVETCKCFSVCSVTSDSLGSGRVLLLAACGAWDSFHVPLGLWSSTVVQSYQQTINLNPSTLNFFYYFIIHMCIQGLGPFSPLPPPPPLPRTLLPPSSPPQYSPETILPLFLILL
jgi:hypothetical protein